MWARRAGAGRNVPTVKGEGVSESSGRNRPAPEQPVTRSGAPGPGAPRPHRTASPRPPARPQFEIALRGYDRTAVEAYLDAQVAERQALRQEVETSDRRRRLAEQHAASTERENRTLREDRAAAVPAGDGFGVRVEKLLRMAEQEAAEAREGASREASALLEQARARAEQHRHEVEQKLIARSSVLDRQSAQRGVEHQEREEQITQQLAAARSEAQALRDAADRAAEQRCSQAEAEAEAVLGTARAEAQRVLEQARQDTERLTVVRGGARADIARLVDLLAVELGDTRSDGGRRPAPGPPTTDQPTTGDRAQAAATGR
jgi:cell division septum initiation protein DivIVA